MVIYVQERSWCCPFRGLTPDLRERDITVNCGSLEADISCGWGTAVDVIVYLLSDEGRGVLSGDWSQRHIICSNSTPTGSPRERKREGSAGVIRCYPRLNPR